ncbi:MAG: CHRD domain-containing protein [Acidobacteria bacterium]|nr:CHRD domain-containing protein [Acidobacteriota bacterium]
MLRRVMVVFAATMLVATVATPANAEILKRTAYLVGGEAVPPVVTGAFGFATLFIDTVARTITYSVDVWNLPSGLTAFHPHAGSRGLAGPTFYTGTVPGPLSNDFHLEGVWRDTDFTARPAQGIRSSDDAFETILMGDVYFNISG